MTATRTRVLVVEDSLTVRKYLCEVLAADPTIEVVGEADNGRLAVELCLSLRPDVVTMDMVMPVMSGLDATEYIMAHVPTPILVVSASTNRGELFQTYQTLAAGAVDVMDKPRADESDETWEERFLFTVKLVSRIRVITHIRGRSRQLPDVPDPAALPAIGARRGVTVVAIGASTGGPAAIVEVLRDLPRTFQVPVLFVLHIGAPFGASFAEWLGGQVGRPVDCGRDGELVTGGTGRVIMAPADHHMEVADGRIRLNSRPERHSCRPSVDVLFETVAREYGRDAAGCLLTGMGRDGALGLLAIRQAGGQTIAQDEATSVVWGMPREAILLGAAERVLPLGEIGPGLAALGAAEARRWRP